MLHTAGKGTPPAFAFRYSFAFRKKYSRHMNELIENITDDIEACLRTLRDGGLILYPTDTIWGIGCDATSDEAVRRVYALKRRADHKAMLTLVDSPGRVMSYVDTIPDIAWDLVELSERPLTIIYPRARGLAPSLLGPDGSVGIRVTRERFSHTLCERFRRPIISTSANLSGEAAPACYDEISQAILCGVDYVVRYRRTDHIPARPSGIIRLGADGTIQLIRE